LGGVPRVIPGKVVILVGGIVGTDDAKPALELGANVNIFDVDFIQPRYLDNVLENYLPAFMSNRKNIEGEVRKVDLAIGTMLLTGANAPRLIAKDILPQMRKRSVMVDVAVDQGGCE